MNKKNPAPVKNPEKLFSREKTAIIVLGGALKKTKDGWRTTNFNEGDNFGVSGDRLRVLAAAVLCHFLSGNNKKITVIASGGKGQYRGTEAPALSRILKKELRELGVPGSKILEESFSNNTYQQLLESAKILKNKNIRNAIVISSGYHLPRIKAFIETDGVLKEFYKTSGLRSAEEILIDFNPGKWGNFIKKAYASKAMKQRIALEKSGEKQIRNRTYGRSGISGGKIKTAIVGLGNITWAYEENPAVTKRMDFPTHFSVLRKHPDFQLIAAQDKDAGARSRFARHAKKFKAVPTIYGSWEEMIRKEQPDLLVVASNTESHVEICSRAIDLGVKNILCEKPIAYSLSAAEKFIRKADKNGCNLYINYLRAFNPSYRELIKNIRSGSLGPIRNFEVRYSRGIFNNGTHMLDLLIRMFGIPKSAVAIGTSAHSIRRFGKNDWDIDACLIFAKDITGTIRYLRNNTAGVTELEIIGDRKELKIVNDKVVSGAGVVSIKEGLYPVYENIYSCISSGDSSKNNCSGEDSLASLMIANRIINSIKK